VLTIPGFRRPHGEGARRRRNQSQSGQVRAVATTAGDVIICPGMQQALGLVLA
jgi:hypothetical protein